jgi:hypothetical protein
MARRTQTLSDRQLRSKPARNGETIRVIAGLVPATPIVGHGRAMMIGVAGTSPAMTTKIDRTNS